MIYIVDWTCYSKETVLKLERRLQAKRVSEMFWFSMFSPPTHFLTASIRSQHTWLFTWDDSPFSGELFELVMGMGVLPAPNCYYAVINTSKQLRGWGDLLERDISLKFKGWEDHAFLLPSDDDSTLSEICDALLRMDKARRDA